MFRREEGLQEESKESQSRLQEAEARNEELASSIASATRPLLRQIESLQATYTTQQASAEKLERSLTQRLGKKIKHYTVNLSEIHT